MLTLTGIWLLGLSPPLQAASLRLGEDEPQLMADSLCKAKQGEDIQQALRQQLQPDTAGSQIRQLAHRSQTPTPTDWASSDANAELPSVFGLTLDDTESSSDLRAELGCESSGGGGSGGGGGGGGGGGSLSGLLPRSSGNPGPQAFLASSLPTTEDPQPPTPSPGPNPDPTQPQIQAVPLESDLAGGLALGLISYGCYRRGARAARPD